MNLQFQPTLSLNVTRLSDLSHEMRNCKKLVYEFPPPNHLQPIEIIFPHIVNLLITGFLIIFLPLIAFYLSLY